MTRDPTRLADLRDAPSPEAAFIGGIIRAQRGAPTPQPKMQELADRLGPLLQENSASPSRALRWLGMSVAAIVLVAGAVSLTRPNERAAPVSISASPAEPAPPPALEPPARIDAPAAIPVEALPDANVRTTTTASARRCDEIELVELADTKLRSGDLTGALAVVREHEQRCAAGNLVQERERIAIEALAKLERVEAAKARARAFEERFPTSPHLRRVRQVVERLEGRSR